MSRLDIDAIVAGVDIDQVVSRVDVQAVADRIDLQALVERLDLAAIANEVIEEIDLTGIIQEAVGSMTNETVGGIRVQSMNADRAISRVVERVLGRAGGRDDRDRPARPTGAALSVSVPTVARGCRASAPGSSRFLADAIDLLVVVAAVVGVYFAVSGCGSCSTPAGSRGRASALNLGTLGWILLIAYLTIGGPTRAHLGQGRARPARGVLARRRSPLWRAFVRASLCAFPIGLFWSAVSSRNESVQDLMVRTTVVYDWGQLPRLQ